MLCNPYILQTKDRTNKEGIYDTSLIVKESIKIPSETAAAEDFQGPKLNENGNKNTTGQDGVIPLILSNSGDMIIKAGKQKIVKNINNFLLFLIITFQNLNPINCLRGGS